MAGKTLTDLTPNEVKLGNVRLPKGTSIQVVQDDSHPDQFHALAVLAWLHRRREDPQAQLEPLLDLSIKDLMAELGHAEDDEDDDGESGDPTAPTT